MDERRAGILLGLLAYTIWGFLTIYWKALHDLGPFQLIGARIISSLVLLSVILAVTHRWRHLAPLARDRALLGRVAIAAVLLTCNWTAYVWAVAHALVLRVAALGPVERDGGETVVARLEHLVVDRLEGLVGHVASPPSAGPAPTPPVR